MKKWHEDLNDNNFIFIIQSGYIINEKASEKREQTLNPILNELEFVCKFVVNFIIKNFNTLLWNLCEKTNFN